MTWNKRFKKQFGPINKVSSSHDRVVFVVYVIGIEDTMEWVEYGHNYYNSDDLYLNLLFITTLVPCSNCFYRCLYCIDYGHKHAQSQLT